MAAPYLNRTTGEVEQLDPLEADARIADGTLIAVHQSRPDQDEVYAKAELAALVPPSIGGGPRAVGPFTSGGAPAAFDVSKPAPPSIISGPIGGGGPRPTQLPSEGGKGDHGKGSFNPKTVADRADKPEKPSELK